MKNLSKDNLFCLLLMFAIPLAWPHLFLKGQVPVDGNVLRLFYPNWTFLYTHPPTGWFWPLWNPYRNMGEPFLADPQSMAAYPPIWFLCRLSSYLDFVRLWIFGHTLLAGYFMAKWVLRQTGVPAAAAASAAVVSLNGYFMAHGSLPNHFAAAAYLPAVFYFFDAGSAIGLGISLAMQWLAGFPPFSFLTGLALLGWSVCAGSSKWKLFGQGTGIALGLAAFQIFPFLELVRHSSRPVFLDPAVAMNFSEPARQLLRMLLVPQWYAWQPQLIGDQAVVSFYLGPFVLVAAGWAVWKGTRRAKFICLAVACSFLLSLGAHLPGYSRLFFLHLFRFPANWLLLSMIGMAWLTGMGISLLEPKHRQWMGTALILVDLLAFAQYVRVPWFTPSFLEEPPRLAQNLRALAPSARLYHSPVLLQALENELLQAEQDYQFLKEFLPPSYGMAFGVKEVSSYQVLKLQRAEQFQARLASEGPSSSLLHWAGVSTVITRQASPGPWGPRNIRVVSISGAKPTLFFDDSPTQGAIQIRNYTPGRIAAHISSPVYRRVVFSEIAYPGWRVSIDGKEQSPDIFQDTFMSVEVPSGQHDVIFGYRPFLFWIGLLITLGTLGLIPWLRNPSPT